MDYESRIAKAEAFMETNRQETDRLYQAISELRKLILDRSAIMDERIAEQSKYVDQRLDEQRKYIDDSLKDLRNAMDSGFKEVRQEASKNLHWMIGLTLLNTSMILGIGGKLFGLY